MSHLDQPQSMVKGRTAVPVVVFFGLTLLILGERSAGALPPADLVSPGADSRLQYVEETAEAGTAPSEFQEVQGAISGLQETFLATMEKLKSFAHSRDVAAKKLHEQLEAASRENERLGTILAENWQKLSALESDKREAQDRIAKLTKAAEQSDADIAGLSQELTLTQSKIESSEGARSEAAARLAETQKELDDIRKETVQLGQELASTRMELEASKTALGAAQDAGDQTRSELDAIRARILQLISPTDAQVQPDDAPTIERPEAREPVNGKSSEGAHRSTGATSASTNP